MTYKKILVTLDGSKLAERALEHVIETAAPKAHITLLSVLVEDRVSEIAALASAVGTTFSVGSDWPPIKRVDDPDEVNARKTYLQGIAEWLEQIGYDVAVEVRDGDPIQEILETANEGYDLVLMVTHGRTGLSKLALGSVTEGVLQKVNCPVLVIPSRMENKQ